MLKAIIGGLVGSQVKQNNPVKGGAAGAAIATAVPFVISRMSLPLMVATGVGGYFAARYFNQKKQIEDKAQAVPASAADIEVDAKPTKRKKAKSAIADTGSIIDPPPGGAADASSADGSSPAFD